MRVGDRVARIGVGWATVWSRVGFHHRGTEGAENVKASVRYPGALSYNQIRLSVGIVDWEI